MYLAIGTPVLNIRLPKKILSEREGLEKSITLVKTFFKMGGLQLQITVADSEELRVAQEKLQEYENLIVRIGGFSAYFNDLSKELQDSVIERTEMAW